jgi:hypothetical protein
MQNHASRIEDRRDDMTHEKERQEEILLHNDISRLREDDEQIDLARDDS